jgi:hypothetical protein
MLEIRVCYFLNRFSFSKYTVFPIDHKEENCGEINYE